MDPSFLVRAIVVATGLSSARTERRIRAAHSHVLHASAMCSLRFSDELNAEITAGVPCRWVNRLLSCRPELPGFDDAAVSNLSYSIVIEPEPL